MPAADLITLISSGGGITVAALLIYELYAPIYLEKDTALAPIVRDVPEQVNDLQEEQQELKEDVEDVQHGQDMVMNVQRAQARANPQMDDRRVSRYLRENGVPTTEFLKDEDEISEEGWFDLSDDEESDS